MGHQYLLALTLSLAILTPTWSDKSDVKWVDNVEYPNVKSILKKVVDNQTPSDLKLVADFVTALADEQEKAANVISKVAYKETIGDPNSDLLYEMAKLFKRAGGGFDKRSDLSDYQPVYKRENVLRRINQNRLYQGRPIFKRDEFDFSMY